MKTRAKAQPKQRPRAEKIMSMRRKNNGKLQFLIKWLNYPDSENTWQLEEIVREQIPQTLLRFLQVNPPGTTDFTPVSCTDVQQQQTNHNNANEEEEEEDEQMLEQQQQQQVEERQSQSQSQEEILESQRSAITQASAHQTGSSTACSTSSLSSTTSATPAPPKLPSLQVKFLCKDVIPRSAAGYMEPTTDTQSVLQFVSANDEQLNCFIVVSPASMYMAEIKQDSPSSSSSSCSITKITYDNGVKRDPTASTLVSYGKNEVISLHNNMFSIFKLAEEEEEEAAAAAGGLPKKKKKFTLTGERRRPVPKPSSWNSQEGGAIVLDDDDDDEVEKRINVIPPLLQHPTMQNIIIAPVVESTSKGGGKETKEEVTIQAFDLSVSRRNWKDILRAHYKDAAIVSSGGYDYTKVRQMDLLDDDNTHNHNLAVVYEASNSHQQRPIFTSFVRFDDSFRTCSKPRPHWQITRGEDIRCIEMLHGGDAVLVKDMKLTLLLRVNDPTSRTQPVRKQYTLPHKCCAHCMLDYRNKLIAIADTNNEIHVLTIAENEWDEVLSFSVADEFTDGAIVMAMQTYGATTATRGEGTAVVDKWKGTLMICSTRGDVLVFKCTTLSDDQEHQDSDNDHDSSNDYNDDDYNDDNNNDNMDNAASQGSNASQLFP